MAIELAPLLKTILTSSVRLWLPLTFGAGFILWVPEEWAPVFRLSAARANFGEYIGPGFVFLAFLTLSSALFSTWPLFTAWALRWWRWAVVGYTWRGLSDPEKTVISHCVNNLERIFYAPRASLAVQRLLDRGWVVASDHGRPETWRFEIEWHVFETINSRYRATVRRHMYDWKEKPEKLQVLKMLDSANVRAGRRL